MTYAERLNAWETAWNAYIDAVVRGIPERRAWRKFDRACRQIGETNPIPAPAN
jgi:hypothetical protein